LVLASPLPDLGLAQLVRVPRDVKSRNRWGKRRDEATLGYWIVQLFKVVLQRADMVDTVYLFMCAAY
jgi:hypothetical protein